MSDEAGRTSVVVVGHVDHGKSTFIGRLLFDTQQLPPEKLAEIKKVSAEQGRRMEYAYITDQFQEERAANVTIDTTQTFLNLGGRAFLIIDAPGHKEYLKNMITGATQAKSALLMLDVKEGVREQTEKHARILKLLGIGHFAILVNKMDAVGYAEEVFRRNEAAVRDALKSFGIEPAAVIPLSAYEGENLTTKSSRMPWYSGMTALEFLLSCGEGPAAPARKMELCFPVQYVMESEGKKIALGRVEQGDVRAGMKAVLFPSGRAVEVKNVLKFKEKPGSASEGECVGVELSSAEDIKRGQILCGSAKSAAPVKNFSCHTFWAFKDALRIGDDVTLECRTQTVPCKVLVMEDDLEGRPTEHLAEGDICRVTFSVMGDVLVDSPQGNESLSRVVFHKNGALAGCGVVAGVSFAAMMVLGLFSAPAAAYIDPGTGVTFVSGIGGFLLGLLALAFGSIVLFFKKWTGWLKALFSRMKNKNKNKPQ